MDSKTDNREIEAKESAIVRDFTKKRVTIQAVQWDGTYTGAEAIKAAFPEMKQTDMSYHVEQNAVYGWRTKTLEGSHRVSEGDWIIRGVKGEYYPCKPDIFEMTYDDAHAAAQADPWVRVDGRKENLPIREKAYWVTLETGKVDKWMFFRDDIEPWLERVEAWMPDDPPPPYTDPREGGADDE